MKQYIAIDLKSFYASVECADRGLDPLKTNLVVADKTRTDKTICLAVSPSLKSFGISGRARLYEALARVEEVNSERRYKAPGGKLTSTSTDITEILSDPSVGVGFITAVPRMSLYMKVSTQIYGIYLRYIAPEDIHVYSIDEVFIDATNYLQTYKMTVHELAVKMIRDVLEETGITATVGIGTNLFLSKVAMDIVAKKMPPDKDGVRIAELDERTFRTQLWDHRPLTDFWRIGGGYSRKLEYYGMFTMGDVARCSQYNEELLYKLFGINAELLIDHAWGWEPCTIPDIKSYRPQTHSVSLGQVLCTPYSFEKARLIVREMTELLVLDLVEKELVTDHMVLSVGYDISAVKSGVAARADITRDYYGRMIPRGSHGSTSLGGYSSSTKEIVSAVVELFDRIADRELPVRRVCIAAEHTIPESGLACFCEQLTLFDDDEELRRKERRAVELKKEKELQRAVISLQRRYGKNAVLKGMNFLEGATTIQRNSQIGGHRA